MANTNKAEMQGEQSAYIISQREFKGVNLQSPREAIEDNEFYWLEEMIPVAAGNLLAIEGAQTLITQIDDEDGAPSLTMQYNAGGVDYGLAIWSNSGNAWIGALTVSSVWARIATGLFTSGQTAAAQYSNQGVLIVDPTSGYYDYNITTADTLTHISGQLYDIEVSANNPSQLATATVPSLRVNDPTGTGGTIGASSSLVTAAITAAGTGYTAGDFLTASGGTLTTASQAPASQQNQRLIINVVTVGGGGAITGISITNPGYYQAAPANAVAVTGGTGTGATFTCTWSVANPYIIAPGVDYTAPVVQAFIGGVWVGYSMTIQSSGTLLGTAIAVYAGRVWVAIDRTVQFTDVDSYSSFGGAGGSFTINDSYLHNTITALAAANNYLYIFGDDSVDILSNVTVVNGITQFSRINASSSIGTNQPRSIFPFQRSLAFANNSGFYVLSGATPEKISDKIDDFVNAIDFTRAVWGFQVVVQGILCAAFLVLFEDSFTAPAPFTRSIFAVLFRGKWWFSSQLTALGSQMNAAFSYPLTGLATGCGWSGNSLYQLISGPNTNDYLVKTKLWDGGAPQLDKQGVQAGIGLNLYGAPTSGLQVYVDNEYGTSILTTIGQQLFSIQWINNANMIVDWENDDGDTVTWVLSSSGYSYFTGSLNAGGGKTLGLTITGNANTSRIRLWGLEMKNTRRW